uniref:Uncharacterized protein n=1 Tax=Zonotrichia albicollis TaxID=44394 RepID=A0A8D2M8G1_ZONAL
MCLCPPLPQPRSPSFRSGSPHRPPARWQGDPTTNSPSWAPVPGILLGRCSGNAPSSSPDLLFPVSSAQILQKQENQKENLDQRLPSLFKRGRRKVVVRDLGKMIYYSKVKLKFQHCQVRLRRLFVGLAVPGDGGETGKGGEIVGNGSVENSLLMEGSGLCPPSCGAAREIWDAVCPGSRAEHSQHLQTLWNWGCFSGSSPGSAVWGCFPGRLINSIRVTCASYQDYQEWLYCLNTAQFRNADSSLSGSESFSVGSRLPQPSQVRDAAVWGGNPPVARAPCCGVSGCAVCVSRELRRSSGALHTAEERLNRWYLNVPKCSNVALEIWSNCLELVPSSFFPPLLPSSHSQSSDFTPVVPVGLNSQSGSCVPWLAPEQYPTEPDPWEPSREGTSCLCCPNYAGKGKNNPPAPSGGPQPPDPHCVDTRCQRLPWHVPGWDRSWCCPSPAEEEEEEEGTPVCVCLSVCAV